MKQITGFDQEQWKNKKYSFFSHKECEVFPCHATDDEENFNCLFCYCPLYTFGERCGGDYTRTERGVMDCSNCTVPHERDNYGYIIQRFEDINSMLNRDENCTARKTTGGENV